MRQIKKWGIPTTILLILILGVYYLQHLPVQPRDLPDVELAKLQGTSAVITDYGYIEAKIYNGSSWKIHDVYVVVSNDNMSRVYKLWAEIDIEPQQERTFTDQGFDRYEGKPFTWRIVRAVGTPFDEK